MSKRLTKLFEIVLMLGAIGSAILIGHRANAAEEGIIKVRSAYSMSDTIARIKGGVTKKGIMSVSGIDWPVRLLVLEDENGQVWAVYNDFEFIAHRHGVANRMKEFKMASDVVASITSTLK